jgi:hypothetical protein
MLLVYLYSNTVGLYKLTVRIIFMLKGVHENYSHIDYSSNVNL